MTPSLWDAERQVIEHLGVTVVNRDRVQELALKNAVFAVGDTFLEILEPVAPDVPGRRFLDQRGGAGGYMACIHVDDIERAVAKAAEVGVRTVLRLKNLEYNEVVINSAHLHPADTGGTFFSFEQPAPADSWAWGGLAWRYHQHTETVEEIVGIAISTQSPERLADRLAEILDVEADGGALRLSNGGAISIVRQEGARHDQMTAVDVRAADRGRVGEEQRIAGTAIRFV